MSNNEENKYRKRHEEGSGGLARDDIRQHDAAGGLSFEKLEQGDESVSFGLVAIADKIIPVDETFSKS